MDTIGVLDQEYRTEHLKWNDGIKKVAKDNDCAQKKTAADTARHWNAALDRFCAPRQTAYQKRLDYHSGKYLVGEAYESHMEGLMSDRTTVLAVQKASIEREANIALGALANAHRMTRDGLIHSVSNCKLKLNAYMDNALAALSAVEGLQH
jgi:hypothetical protein